MEDNTIIIITSIIGLVVLETVNLLVRNQDGAILMSISSLISGLAGYKTGVYKSSRQKGDTSAQKEKKS